MEREKDKIDETKIFDDVQQGVEQNSNRSRIKAAASTQMAEEVKRLNDTNEGFQYFRIRT